jgi:hypothetical protein
VKVYVALGDEQFNGDLYTDEGSSGYSEWTPGEPAELMAGDHDIFARLWQMEDKVVTLWISDEPINTLDPPPVR